MNENKLVTEICIHKMKDFLQGEYNKYSKLF